MTQKLYSMQVLKDLCGPAKRSGEPPQKTINDFFGTHWFDAYEVRPDGVWLLDAPPGESLDVAEWHPRRDRERPALPLPFSVHDLAAFMLSGGGAGLFEKFYNASNGESNGVALDELGPNADKAREVWLAAFVLIVDATAQFGRSDEAVRQAADWLLAATPKSAPPRLSKHRMPDHEDRIVAWLRDNGYDLMNVPNAPLGKKKWRLNVDLKAALGLTDGQAKKAWANLRRGPDARVKHAPDRA
jgi:hypothetical protein